MQKYNLQLTIKKIYNEKHEEFNIIHKANSYLKYNFITFSISIPLYNDNIYIII